MPIIDTSLYALINLNFLCRPYISLIRNNQIDVKQQRKADYV